MRSPEERCKRNGTCTRQSTWRLFLVPTPTPSDRLTSPPLDRSTPLRTTLGEEEGGVLCRNYIPGPRGTNLFPASIYFPMEQVTVPVLVYLIMNDHHQRFF
jgi:hypothetical protein